MLITFCAITICVGISHILILSYGFNILNDKYRSFVFDKYQQWRNIIECDLLNVNDGDHISKLISSLHSSKQSSEIDTFFIFDNNGYVLQSIQPKDVGKRVGEVDPRLLTYETKQTTIRGRFKTSLVLWKWYEHCETLVMPNSPICHKCHDKDERRYAVAFMCFSFNSLAAERDQHKNKIIAISALTTFLLSLIATYSITKIIK